ncbi:hypothetical protein NC653_023177 [Populus alba x Populus x berolinensis]|uniref:Uncharacterized protein n=1 Tax=Populus alba x Populus x berolinensis TaxID=444605 RepID=A0AAD6QBS8_9ROSI|nr:hypothetical protein NC653_023177 [Populus alba x Populus x berolinensis]
MDPRQLRLYMEPAKESVVLNGNLYGNIEPYATGFLKFLIFAQFTMNNQEIRLGIPMMSAWDLHRAWPEAGLKVALGIFLPIIKAEGIRATLFPITMQTYYRTPTVR